MDSSTIRKTFFDFFEERGHTLVPSSSLVPNDPTLLLTNAGMIQFKPYFLGEQSAPYRRAMSVQKCFRTPDIDEVGKTARHLTFFEMLGNFSFGDYYKEKACPWGWELVTEGFGVDVDRLWITIYETDDEAYEIWADLVGVRPERIVRMGKKDNFWDMGVAGPCGPCSEINVDLGDRYGPASDVGPKGNEDRYLEIWNLVFMQNDCNAQIEPVADLPKKNIDTGSGLERVALVLQEVESVFETDILAVMVQRAEELTKKKAGTDSRTDRALRILADHGRGTTLLIGDGVLPSNEERGYVLRRIMRRAVRHARLLGYREPVLGPLVETTVELMGDAYPAIREKRDFIAEVASREEEKFDGTLRQGMTLLESEIDAARERGTGTLPGEVAFRLHDTFGFPIDITTEIGAEAGLEVDKDGFEALMAGQRERARAARRAAHGVEPGGTAAFESLAPTEFIGFEHLRTDARVVALARGAGAVPSAEAGDEVEVVLDSTVFYAEGGGQVGDRGIIKGPAGTADVIDTTKVAPGVVGHQVMIREGSITVGDEVEAIVDPGLRAGAERAHTATHLLHWLLRTKLGEQATQAGSLVEPGRLRFDFNHFEPLGKERMDEFTDELQSLVISDDLVRTYETSYEFARSIGAMAIFGEKYGDFVRVVEIGDYSKELCGGTHVPHTSQVGAIVVTSAGSIGANLRRVEALTGPDGLDWLRRRVAVLERAADSLKVSPDEVAERVDRLLATQKDMELRIGEIDRASAADDADTLAGAAVDLDGTRLVVARRDVGVDGLRSLAQTLKGRLGSAVIVLGTAEQGRANLVGAVTKDLVARGISARDLLAPGAGILGGGAGGRPDLAISGGPAADRIDEAIAVVASSIRDLLSR